MPKPLGRSSSPLLSHNKSSIYVKSDLTSSMSEVAIPTPAMMKGGTEIRLFFTVFVLLFVFLSPAVVLMWNSFHPDVVRARSAMVALALLLWPLYGTSRYKPGAGMALIMSLRGVVLPGLFGLCMVPSGAPWGEKMPFVVGFGVLELIVFGFRKSCEPRTGVDVTRKDAKLRILIVGDALPPKVDGVATFAEHSIKLLQKRGHTLHLVTSIAGPEKFGKAPVTRFPGMTTPISPGHSITLPLPNVLLTIQEFKPHAIHLFEVSPLNLAMFGFCQLIDVPVSFSHHTRLDLYVNIVTPQFPLWLNAIILFTLERVFYPLADAHLCVSTVLFEKVKRRGTSEVRQWSSGVDSSFDRSKRSFERREQLSGGKPDLPLVMHVGRLGPEKNSDEIPRIIKETCKIMSNKVRFAVVGDGILKPTVEKEIRENGNECVFAGFLRGNNLHEAYASCDVFFSPSTTEGYPLVFLEAMASGLAVVGPIAGGIPDQVDEGIQGSMYEPHDAKSAAQAIKRAIEGGQKMREAAYAKGRSFSWEKSVTELEDVLRFITLKKHQSGWRAALC